MIRYTNEESLEAKNYMKLLAILKDEDSLKSMNCLSSGQITIHDTILQYALAEVTTPTFNLDINPNSVLIQKKAFSCNYRDIGLMFYHRTQFNDTNIFTPIGSDFSGIVIDKGKNVKTLEIGDRVIPNSQYPMLQNNRINEGVATNHASLEYEIFHEKKVMKMPDSMSFEIGAGFTIGAQTAYSMIEKLQIKPGKKVLITGITANTSLFILSALKNKNVDIFATARNYKGLTNINTLHSDKIFLVGDDVVDFLDVDAIHDHISIFGKFDYVIDPFSDTNLFRLINILGINGKYITCGTSNQLRPEKHNVDTFNFFAQLIINNISIIGNCLGSTAMVKKALAAYDKKLFDIPVCSIIENDSQKFMDYTFLSKPMPGKVIFKY